MGYFLGVAQSPSPCIKQEGCLWLSYYKGIDEGISDISHGTGRIMVIRNEAKDVLIL